MEVVQSDDYEELAATYQVLMMHWLNTSLRESGVTDVGQRRRIVADFCGRFGGWHDQYWFENPGGNMVFPLIAFSTDGPATAMDLDQLRTVNFPNRSFSFSEYASGNILHYFEELREDVGEIRSSPKSW